MKTNIKQISRRSLAIILALMTMFSTMILGTIGANATISKWYITSWTLYGNWNFDESHTISGSSGEITFDRGSATGDIYFRVFADEGGKHAQNSDTETLTADSEVKLNWVDATTTSGGEGRQFKFTNTKRYVTIHLYQNNGNYVKVTESDGDAPASDTVQIIGNPVNTWEDWTYMTKVSDNLYRCAYSPDGNEKYFRLKINNAEKGPEGDKDITIGTESNKTQLTNKGTAGKAYKLENLSGKAIYIYTDKTYVWYALQETTYAVSVVADPSAGGTVSPTSVQAGSSTNPTITATPADGYTFKNWETSTGVTVADASNATTTVSATQAGTVTAKFEAAKVDYYIGGRFMESWNASSQNHKFTEVSENLYKFETDKSVAQLSTNQDNLPQYFLIHTGNGNSSTWYGGSNSSGYTFHNNKENSKLSLSSHSGGTDENKLIKFANQSDSSSPVTIWMETNNGVPSNLWYSVEGDTPGPGPEPQDEYDTGTEITSGKYAYVLYATGNTNDPKFGKKDTSESKPMQLPIYKRQDGTLYAKIDSSMLSSNKEYSFMLSGDEYGKSAYYQTSGSNKDVSYTIISTDSNAVSAKKLGSYTYSYNGDHSFQNAYLKVNSDQVTKVIIELGKEGKNSDQHDCVVLKNSDNVKVDTTYYNFVIRPVVDTTIKAKKDVYIADGTIRGGSDTHEGNVLTSAYGNTTVTNLSALGSNISESNHTDYYYHYKVAVDSTIQVQTTMKDNYQYTDTFDKSVEYVSAYVVNGVKYDAEFVPSSESGNTHTYRLKGGYTIADTDSYLEIYPIYSNRTIEANGDYITLYVDASKVTGMTSGKWGNMVSVYSYYYNVPGTSSSYTGHGEGAYPGQPMYYDTATGYYVAKVAKTYYSIYGSTSKTKTAPVSGVTFNSYTEGADIHNSTNFVPATGKNYQSYDYDDFAKIAAISEIDTVRFTFKDPEISQTNQKTLVNNDNKTGGFSSSKNLSDYNLSATNWENLKNFAGDKDRSILGYEEGLSSTKYLQVVSTGNRNTTSSTSTSKVGEWSTIWYVYDQTGAYVTYGTPSDFIPKDANNDGKITDEDFNSANLSKQSSQVQTIWNKDYGKTIVKVAFEDQQDAKSSTSTGNSGVRSDGVWVYTASTDVTATAKVSILVANTEAGAKALDTYATEDVTDVRGVTSGGEAYFVTTSGNVREVTDKINTELTYKAEDSTNYKFVGWYTKNEDGSYTAGNKAAENSLTLAGNTEVYALFVPKAGAHVVSATLNAGAEVTNVISSYTSENATGIFGDTTGASASVKTSTTAETRNLENVAQGTPVTLTATNGDGYNFLGWYTESEGKLVKVFDNATYLTGNTTLASSNVTYYALYAKKVSANAKVEYEITSGDDAGTFAQDTTGAIATPAINGVAPVGNVSTVNDIQINSSVALTTNLVDNKYEFQAWYVVIDGEPVKVSDLTEAEYALVDENTTFIARYISKVVTNNITVNVNYYQRKFTAGQPVDIDSTGTKYVLNIEANSDMTYAQLLTLIGSYINIDSVTDTYTLKNKGTDALHSNQYGKANTDNQPWAKFGGNTKTDAELSQTIGVLNTVDIWLENAPKTYTVNVLYPTSEPDITSHKYSDGNQYMAYFNTRIGQVLDSSVADAATDYLSGYGVTGSTGEEFVAPAAKIGAYNFIGWSTDAEGKNIVSTDIQYLYRITGNTTLYAQYSANAEKSKGVSITAAATDYYTTAAGADRIRINDILGVVGYEEENATTYNKAITNVGVVYILVADATQLTEANIKSIQSDISNNFDTYTNNEKHTSQVGTIGGVATKGYFSQYYAVTDGVLTNKNRVQISYYAGSYKFADEGTYEGILAIGVAKADGNIYVSTDYVLYAENGVAITAKAN